MILDRNHIIAYGLAIALALFGVYSIEARLADKAESRATIAETKAQLAQQQNSQFQAQVSAQLAQLSAENASLTQALAQRDKAEKSIPTTNGSLSATQVAQGISTATNAKPGEVTANGNFITFDLPLGQLALTDMQLVPLLTQDKANLQTQVSNDAKELSLEKQAHKSDVDTDRATLVACQAEVKAAKADARKGKLKWFGIGVVVGFLGRGISGL